MAQRHRELRSTGRVRKKDKYDRENPEANTLLRLPCVHFCIHLYAHPDFMCMFIWFFFFRPPAGG